MLRMSIAQYTFMSLDEVKTKMDDFYSIAGKASFDLLYICMRIPFNFEHNITDSCLM